MALKRGLALISDKLETSFNAKQKIMFEKKKEEEKYVLKKTSQKAKHLRIERNNVNKISLLQLLKKEYYFKFS